MSGTGVRAGPLLGAVAVAAALTFAGLGLGMLIARHTQGVPAAPDAPQPWAASAPAQPVQWTEGVAGGRYYSADERNNIAIYDALNEGVVNVSAEGSVVFRYRPIPRSDAGSGVIIDAEGHVLTSHHVIRNATRLTVTLWDGSEHRRGARRRRSRERPGGDPLRAGRHAADGDPVRGIRPTCVSARRCWRSATRSARIGR